MATGTDTVMDRVMDRIMDRAMDRITARVMARITARTMVRITVRITVRVMVRVMARVMEVVAVACLHPTALGRDQTYIVPDLTPLQDHQAAKHLLGEVLTATAVVHVIPIHRDRVRDHVRDHRPLGEEGVADMRNMMIGVAVEARAVAATIAMAIGVDLAAALGDEDRGTAIHCMISSKRHSVGRNIGKCFGGSTQESVRHSFLPR